jgi:hypothetical protein
MDIQSDQFCSLDRLPPISAWWNARGFATHAMRCCECAGACSSFGHDRNGVSGPHRLGASGARKNYWRGSKMKTSNLLHAVVRKIQELRATRSARRLCLSCLGAMLGGRAWAIYIGCHASLRVRSEMGAVSGEMMIAATLVGGPGAPDGANQQPPLLGAPSCSEAALFRNTGAHRRRRRQVPAGDQLRRPGQGRDRRRTGQQTGAPQCAGMVTSVFAAGLVSARVSSVCSTLKASLLSKSSDAIQYQRPRYST